MTKIKNNYVDNIKLDAELMPFVTEVNKIIEDNADIINEWRIREEIDPEIEPSKFRLVMVLRGAGVYIPPIPDYVAVFFMELTERIATTPRWAGYTWRDEMISEGLEDCLKRVYNYNNTAVTQSGNPNPFGYFTRMVIWAFSRRKDKELENLQNSANIIDAGCIENHLTINENDRDLPEATNYIQNTKQKMDEFKAKKPLDGTVGMKTVKQKVIVDKTHAVEYDNEIKKFAKRYKS